MFHPNRKSYTQQFGHTLNFEVVLAYETVCVTNELYAGQVHKANQYCLQECGCDG